MTTITSFINEPSKSNLLLRRGRLVNRLQPVQRPRVSDEGQELRDDIDEALSAVPHPEVGPDVGLHLRVAAAERDEHAEGEKLASRDVNAGAGQVVAEAVGGQQPLDVLLVGGGR